MTVDVGIGEADAVDSARAAEEFMTQERRMSALRTQVLCRLGASPRIAVGRSHNPSEGRAVYAYTDMRAGAFLVLYTGTWREVRSDRAYSGIGRNVVECHPWRINPAPSRACGGQVDDTQHIGAMFNEPNLKVLALPCSPRVVIDRLHVTHLHAGNGELLLRAMVHYE